MRFIFFGARFPMFSLPTPLFIGFLSSSPIGPFLLFVVPCVLISLPLLWTSDKPFKKYHASKQHKHSCSPPTVVAWTRTHTHTHTFVSLRKSTDNQRWEWKCNTQLSFFISLLLDVFFCSNYVTKCPWKLFCFFCCWFSCLFGVFFGGFVCIVFKM